MLSSPFEQAMNVVARTKGLHSAGERFGITIFAVLTVACGAAKPPPVAAPNSQPALETRPSAPSTDRPSDEAECFDPPCRPARTIELFVDATLSRKIHVPSSPYVLDDTISLIHDDDIRLAADRVGDKLVGLRLAEEGEAAISLKFRHERFGDRFAMVLLIAHPYELPLRYAASIHVGRHPTKSCPVYPDGIGIETWFFPMIVLHLRDFRLVSPESEKELVCD